jgi:hypothetical protein
VPVKYRSWTKQGRHRCLVLSLLLLRFLLQGFELLGIRLHVALGGRHLFLQTVPFLAERLPFPCLATVGHCYLRQQSVVSSQ